MPPRICLIEDDKPLRTVLARFLIRNGYDVIQAEHGRKALQEMADKPADLVITDMIMPEMDGVETIVALRRDYPKVKIIAISGGGIRTADQYLQLAQMLGAHKAFSKPIVPQELLNAISNLVGVETQPS
ncbi:MAG TPA: response regulator [Verrucomicrobiae bacterium]|nr:response regulator [Verrucomicrobiae bacterium]